MCPSVDKRRASKRMWPRTIPVHGCQALFFMSSRHLGSVLKGRLRNLKGLFRSQTISNGVMQFIGVKILLRVLRSSLFLMGFSVQNVSWQKFRNFPKSLVPGESSFYLFQGFQTAPIWFQWFKVIMDDWSFVDFVLESFEISKERLKILESAIYW